VFTTKHGGPASALTATLLFAPTHVTIDFVDRSRKKDEITKSAFTKNENGYCNKFAHKTKVQFNNIRTAIVDMSSAAENKLCGCR
jgi:hypothetical protein